jgi:hypothetical protein
MFDPILCFPVPQGLFLGAACVHHFHECAYLNAGAGQRPRVIRADLRVERPLTHARPPRTICFAFGGPLLQREEYVRTKTTGCSELLTFELEGLDGVYSQAFRSHCASDGRSGEWSRGVGAQNEGLSRDKLGNKTKRPGLGLSHKALSRSALPQVLLNPRIQPSPLPGNGTIVPDGITFRPLPRQPSPS